MLKTNTWPWRLTLKLEVIHFFHMTLLISGCMPAIDSILMSNLTYSRSRISENSLIHFRVPDLDVWPWFFEFLHLDYVEFNIKIASQYVWLWFSRSTMEVRWHILVILRFQTSDMFKSTPNIVSLSRIQPMMNKGSQKYLWPWFSRSFFEVKWQILITARSVASNTMKSTRRSSLYYIYTVSQLNWYPFCFANKFVNSENNSIKFYISLEL